MSATTAPRVSDSQSSQANREYWPALDGVRGLAVLLVVAGHAGLLIGPTGGQVGVTVFFVLSGFLITSIIAHEWSQGSGFSFRAFYKRRAARLLPALTVYLLVVSLVVASIAGWAEVFSATWPAVIYVANFAEILGHEMAYNQHTWSLAVEEHFYFIWPALFVFVPGLRNARSLIIGTTLLVGFRFLIGNANDMWAYHGTFTNGYALTLGCALALAHRSQSSFRLPFRSAEAGGLLLVALGFISLNLLDLSETATLVAVGVWLPLIAAALTGIVIWDLINRQRGDNSPFTWVWLRHAGRISYGWYLWHAPFLFISVFNNTPEKRLFWVVATFAIAEVSWRVVERPILQRVRSKVPE